MARLSDRPQPPPQSPFLPPAPRPQLPPASPALQQRAWAAFALSVLSLITMMLIGNLQRGVYVAGVALAVAVLGLWLSVSAMSAARRAGTRRPRGAAAGSVIGAVGCLFSGLAVIGFLIFSTQLTQYQNCMNGASTAAAQTACQTQLSNSIGGPINILGAG